MVRERVLTHKTACNGQNVWTVKLLQKGIALHYFCNDKCIKKNTAGTWNIEAAWQVSIMKNISLYLNLKGRLIIL